MSSFDSFIQYKVFSAWNISPNINNLLVVNGNGLNVNVTLIKNDKKTFSTFIKIVIHDFCVKLQRRIIWVFTCFYCFFCMCSYWLVLGIEHCNWSTFGSKTYIYWISWGDVRIEVYASLIYVLKQVYFYCGEVTRVLFSFHRFGIQWEKCVSVSAISSSVFFTDFGWSLCNFWITWSKWGRLFSHL